MLPPRAGLDRAGKGREGQGRAGEGRGGQDRAGQGRAVGSTSYRSDTQPQFLSNKDFLKGRHWFKTHGKTFWKTIS